MSRTGGAPGSGGERSGHGVKAAVDVDNLAGDGARQVRQQEAGNIGNRVRVGLKPT